ncbi:hypothetical protein [Nocardiopsis lucentensis]|uniref:hypothetical protein n=1 Tax=Nocardiopsis lucentensis TaxID=53441 RepID=UPI00037D7630|nr:hypothetical protein [Nocardiopsis lucentensis]
MSSSISPADVADAAQLVALGMRPRQLPTRDPIYADFVRRHNEDPLFAETTAAVADGLGLTVLGCDRRTGLVVAAREGSLFEVRMEEYVRRTSARDRGERALHGLVHLATAALAFPRPDDLVDDSYVGRTSVDQIDGVVRQTCQILEERSAKLEENSDPEDGASDLERLWQIYKRRPETTRTKDGRLAPSTTRGMVSKALKFLADQGLLAQVNGEGGGTYRTTPRYQAQVRDLAADAAFNELLELGVVAVADGSGSLHVLDADEE